MGHGERTDVDQLTTRTVAVVLRVKKSAELRTLARLTITGSLPAARVEYAAR
jgi:hypothetical protein